MKGEHFRVIAIYLTPPFVYHQSILVTVKVDIDALIDLYLYKSTFFRLKREFNSLVDDFENARK